MNAYLFNQLRKARPFSIVAVTTLLSTAGWACFTPDRAQQLAKSHPDPTFSAQATHSHQRSQLPFVLAESSNCEQGFADIFPCENIDLLAHIPLIDIGGGSGSDSWGWRDPQTGREYAIIGRSNGVAFVDVSDPQNVIYMGNLPRPSNVGNTVWADIKVYKDHAFMVADAVLNYGMQVFDLTQLRGITNPPVTFSATASYSGFNQAHNIAINTDTGFAYAVGGETCLGGLHMIDIREPQLPEFAGCFSADGYSHDVQCVIYTGPDTDYQQHEICFASNEDTLTIVDVSDKQNPRQLSRTSYSFTGYTHQGWLTADQQYFVMDDELDEQTFVSITGTRTITLDVGDLDNPRVAGFHRANGQSIDHNQYVVGDYTYQANYRRGLRVLHLDDAATGTMSEVAFFDTFPEGDGNGFSGAWNVYPFFPSGNILISDAERGFFLVRPSIDTGLTELNGGNGDDFTPVPIEFGHSGAWFNSERDGEGWQVEVLSADSAVSFWHTYPAGAGNSEGQFWMGGPGRIEGDQIIVDNVFSTSGPVFGPDFDPADVGRTPWGRFIIEFADCGHGRITYEGPPEFGSGTVMIERLTGNPRMPCGVDPDAFPAPVDGLPGISGNWFDPAHDGEGWFIQEVAPGVAVLSWLTYNDQGEQVWFVGVGQWNGRTLIVPRLQITRGTAFGDDFNAADVIREAWGAVQFVFLDCNTATVSYAANLAIFGQGFLEPVRLTRSQSLPCAFDPLGDLSSGQWNSRNEAPKLSELPSVVLGDAIYLGGGYQTGFRSRAEFWRFRPALNEWTQLSDLPQARDHSMMTVFAGDIYFFGGFLTQFEQAETASAWRYDPAIDEWQTITAMPGARAAGGAASVGEHIYILGGDRETIDRYTPATDSWVSFALDEAVGRDHSAVVVYQEEIWLIGGRANGRAHTAVTIFNPLTGVSRPGPSLQRGRSGFGATVHDGQIIVGGGEDFAPPETIGSVEYFNPESGLWQFAPNLPTPVHGVSAVSLDGTVYFLLGSTFTGGVNNPGVVQSYTNTPAAQ